MFASTTSRWTPLKYHKEQNRLWNSPVRFKVIPSGRRSGKCIAKNSRVYLVDGTVKYIQDIKENDLIWSMNDEYKLEPKKVKYVLSNGEKETLKIVTNKQEIICTYNHPFLINNKWIEAKDIKITDLIAKAKVLKNHIIDKDIVWEEVKDIIKHNIVDTYDLTVEDNHNFIVNGLVTHNTELAKRKLVVTAMRGTQFDKPAFFAGAPTRDQAKGIFWEDLKDLVPKQFIKGRPRESDLTIELVNNAKICVVGLDVPERIEGRPWDGGILDEYGNMRKKAWEENIRPALSDRKGWCWFIGVPEGRNHYYALYKYALSKVDSEWDGFHWISADILDEAEINSARNLMDRLTYEQEYEGSFLNFQGQIYYNFNEKIHCKRLKYFPNETLFLCMDFNIKPGTSTIIQEQELTYLDNDKILKSNIGSGIIGEVYINSDSNTEKICKLFLEDWKNHKGNVICFGDATGGSGGSAKVKGSDWDIVKSILYPVFGSRLTFEIPIKNPNEKPRINSVNSRLMSIDGTVRMMVDNIMAPKTIEDFEGVQTKEGTTGEIDKHKSPELSHLTDGIGYYTHKKYPITEETMTKARILGI